jgi:hypothetical protein
MGKWNLTENEFIKYIRNSINLLFTINYIDILPIQYICKNLNYYFKKHDIKILYNKKIRNINTYIKKELKGFFILIKNYLNKSFEIKENFLILIKSN